MTTPPPPPPLFLLPQELRHRIWTLVVVSSTPIKVRRRNWRGLVPFLKGDDRYLFTSNLNLAFTCRTLWKEVTPLYYSTNTFKFNPPNLIPDFVKAIGPANARAITRIETDLCDLWTASFLDKLLGGVTSVEIACLACDSGPSRRPLHRREQHAKHVNSLLLCSPEITLTYQGKKLNPVQALHREPKTR